MKKLFTILCFNLLIFVLVAQDREKPIPKVLPEDAFKYDQVLPSNRIPDHQPKCENYLLDVMFADDAMVRLRNGELTDLQTNATDGIQTILNQLTWFEWTRFSEVPEEILDALSENGSRSSGQSVYNLNNIYRLKIPEQKNIWELSTALQSLPGIIYARPVPKPAQLPVPPSYQDLQGYLNPSSDIPSGIDAEYAWTKSGGTGSNIKICDLEYSWNYNHADVTKAVGSQINSNVADPYNSTHHGTAVIGVLVSNNNGWGTTGATYNSALRTCGTYYGFPSPSYNPAGAITLSIANLVAGDIILLEQQSDYTGYDGYVPIEWYGNYSPNPQTNNPVYAAIVNAVANGIHVVEAGGNGNVNTGNLTWYGNSGAVIVGAGGGYAADNLRKLGFSSYGPRFDVQGWGENVMTTGYGSYYSSEGLNYYYRSDFNGTSSASPIVTSAIACFEGYWKSNVSGTPPTPSIMRAILKRHSRLQVNPADGLIGNRPDLKAMINGYMYCAASGGCDEYISRVQFGTIDNSSACNNYVDYTSICSTDLAVNGFQPITVTNGQPYPSDQCGIWVDWNRDGDFYDANETISVTGNPGYGPYTANITPPAGQTQGTCRVRVRITYTGAVDPCGTTSYGEVEDYTINLTAPVDNIWTGVVSNNWNDPANWSLLHVPYSTENTVISNGTPYECWIWTTNATCNNMTIAAGTYLRNYDKTLTINGNLSINGQLMMDNSTSSAITQVNGNINWNSGSTAWTADATNIKVAGNWTFYSGSNAQLSGGVMFIGSSNSFVYAQDANCSFFRFGNYKPAGNWVSISASSTASLTINDSFYNQTDAVTYIYSSYPVIIKGEFYNNGHLYCGTGTVVFDGVSHGVEMNAGDHFNNLTVSSSGNVTLNTDIDVNGNVLIESGALYAVGRTINVGGDWTNQVGTFGFLEGNSRVIFDGPGHQLVKSNETFNILEARMGAALRIEDPAGFTVTCNQYDWTSGGIDVVEGTFTAFDLVDNGLYGTYWCNPGGTLNLTQDAGQYTDLHGEIHVFGGTMTVTGGWGQSYWPYFDNATIEMTGGVLDFINNGIYLYNGGHSLTENITGGTIRTNASFTGDRADFTPSGGTIELYGSTDVQLSHGFGSNFYNILVNKSASKDDLGNIIEEKIYDRKGNLIENSRSNIVSSATDLVLLKNMTIQNGQLYAPSSIKLKGNWTNYVGTSGFIEENGTVTFNNDDHQYCYGEDFYTLELNMAFMDLHIPAGTTTTCQIYDWNSGELEVQGGTFIAYDLFDNGLFGSYYITSAGGLMELHQDNSQYVDLAGKITIVNGTMNVYGGNGYSYWPYNGNGEIWMSGGILDFKDNGVLISDNSYSLTDNITGGIVRMSKGFAGYRSDFTPTGGEFEFYGSGDNGLYQTNGCTLKNVKINKSAKDTGGEPTGKPEYDERSGMQISDGGKSNTITILSDFTITGNLNIAAGTFDLGSYSCDVNGTTDISGTLAMTNPANDLTSYSINWNTGSNDNINNGKIEVDNWNFNEGTNAALSAPNLAVVKLGISPYDADAEFGNFKAAPFSKNMQNTDAYYPVRVSGNCTFAAGANWQTTVDWIIGGNLTIENTASFLVQNEADLLVNGSFTHAGSLMLSSSTTALIHGDYAFANTGALNVLNGTFTNDYGIGIAILEGTLQLPGGSVEFPNRSVSLAGTFNDQITGGTFRFGGTFAAGSAGVFQPTGGSVEFINASSGNYIQVVGDNFLYDVILNKPGSSLQVYDNLTIKGDLTINAGTLNSNNKTISIAGDWNNNVGTTGFTETMGKVIFNGSDVQFCSTEDFYTLEMNKPSSLLYNISGSSITCLFYDWVSGGLFFSSGNFTAYDLADDGGLVGTYAIWNGTMELHQSPEQYVDINGDITIGPGGNMIVYGDNFNGWSFFADVNLTMSGGVLDFKNGEIFITNSPHTFTENITGGIIRTPKGFIAINPGFTPVGGTVELYGGGPVSVETRGGSNLFNLTINKSGGLDDPMLNTFDMDGKSEPQSKGNQVIMSGNTVVNGFLNLNAGELFNGGGYQLTCLGNMNIGSGATFTQQANSQLRLNAELNVNSGGWFVTDGVSGSEPIVTKASTNYYTFSVNTGGNISADSTIFEYMGVNGINVKTGALVDPANAFNYCTFKNGGSGQTLLMVNNDQELTCTGAKFPSNTWSGLSNITKWVNQGRMTFYDFSGGFSGPSFETDLFDRVDWFVPQLSATPTTINVTPPAGSTTFNISSNLAWTIAESISWVTLSTNSGNNNTTITVNYDENANTSSRSGTITISAAGVPDVVITINQAGATLSVTPSMQNVGAAAGSTNFTLTSNTNWIVSESTSWFSVLPGNGTGNNTLVVTYDANPSVTARSGQITLSSGGLPGVVVTVNQAGVTPTLTVSPSNRDVTPPAGTTTFSITSNTGWAVSETATWFSVAPVSGTGNGTITVTYDQNTTAAARMANVVVTATGGTPTQTVSVTQAGASLSVLPAAQSVTAAAGTTTFNLTSNTIWTASESTSWFTISPSGGTGNNTITVTYDQNTSVTPRSGQITFSSTGLANVVVTVNQAGASSNLTVLPSNRDVTPPAGTTTFAVTSNTGWAVSESVSWFSVAPGSGTGNGTLTVNYGENATGFSRTGNITVTATGGAPVVTVTVTQSSYPTHNIMLPPGWTGLSSYIMPANNAIEDVFAPVLPDFIIAQTKTGMYYPAIPVNTIGDWLSQSAYKVKMSNQAVLPIIGNEELNKTFALSTGWNLVPVICNAPVNVVTLFPGTALKILKDVAGLGIYWPEYGINTIGSLLPGSAYYANMNTPGSVAFPANAKEAVSFEMPSRKFPESSWNDIEITASSHQIAILNQGMEGVLTGDILGVFDENGHCYGVAILDLSNENSIITAYANDEMAIGKTGFLNGELMQFRLYRPSTNETMEVIVRFDSRLPQQEFYQNEGLSAISGLKVSNVGVTENDGQNIRIFPNPAAGVVSVSGITEFSTIEIYTSDGSQVKTIQTGNVEQMTFDIANLSKGIYQLRFKSSQISVYKKLIKN